MIWLFVLLPFFIMDWDERRRKRFREICKGDALIKLWRIIIDVKDDGSSDVSRKIKGVNLAEKREYYELEAWTDPDRDEAYETQLKEKRKITVTVATLSKGRTEKQSISNKKKYPPDIAHKVNRIVHIIPVSKNGHHLKPDDWFEIVIDEKTEKNTWKMEKEDYYQHKVKHVTEKLKFEMRMPKEWNFPELSSREKYAKAMVKDPTCGEWEPLNEKPKVAKKRGRWYITLEIEYPKLLHIYKLAYHPMTRVQSD